MLGLLAQKTASIRLGIATIQLGTRKALTVAEDFQMLSELYGGRFDIGLGRPAGRYLAKGDLATREISDAHRHLWEMQRSLAIMDEESNSHEWFEGRIAELVDLLSGALTAEGGLRFGIADSIAPGLQLWIMGVNAGSSPRLAGKLGMRFASAMHIHPAGVQPALTDYHSAFTATQFSARPIKAVTAQVIPDLSKVRSAVLRRMYEAWLAQCSNATGAPRLMAAEAAIRHQFTPREAVFARQRSDAAFTGSPAAVAQDLQNFASANSLDDLLIYLPFGPSELRHEALQLLATELDISSDLSPHGVQSHVNQVVGGR